jgi:PAS domain S-box-containing protein
MLFGNKGVVMLDLNGPILFASSYFCDLVGVEYDQAHDKSCFEFVFQEDLDEAKERFATNKLPHASPFRFRLRRVDGTAVCITVLDSNGYYLGGFKMRACALTASTA